MSAAGSGAAQASDTGVAPSPTLPCELASQYAVDGDGAVWLRAARCAVSGDILYPPRPFCGNDLAETQEVLLAGQGRVNCVTRVRVRPPYGLPPGYMIGFVDLDTAPVRLFGLFAPETAEEIDVGSRVSLSLRPIGVDNDGAPCLRPVFVPERPGAKEGSA